MLTQAELKSMLSYDKETGEFVWIRHQGRKMPGDSAGYVSWHGYVEIKINKKVYWAHRLAWLFVHGAFPPEHTDHVDGNRANNSLCNLRLATRAQNNQNHRTLSKKNTSGFVGVHKSLKKWRAVISVNNKKVNIGTFETAELAHKAFLEHKRLSHEFCTI